MQFAVLVKFIDVCAATASFTKWYKINPCKIKVPSFVNEGPAESWAAGHAVVITCRWFVLMAAAQRFSAPTKSPDVKKLTTSRFCGSITCSCGKKLKYCYKTELNLWKQELVRFFQFMTGPLSRTESVIWSSNRCNCIIPSPLFFKQQTERKWELFDI